MTGAAVGSRNDSYYLRVEELLRDWQITKRYLHARREKLKQDYAEIPDAVCLRAIPTDKEIIPGSKNPFGRIEGDIKAIEFERKACKREMCDIERQIQELDKVIDCARRLSGKPGQIIHWLYFDQRPWDWVEAQGFVRSEISRYRQEAFKKVANRCYSRIRSVFVNPN